MTIYLAREYFLFFPIFVTMNYKDIDIEERANQAVGYFKSGYNCAQSVLMAYADLFEMDLQTATHIAAPFGAGMGRLREICGTVSGMFMIVGLAVPTDNPNDMESKTRNYAFVQRLAERFREENGSIICRELLGLNVRQENPRPEPRTENYYRKRPCIELVRFAATLIGEELKAL